MSRFNSNTQNPRKTTNLAGGVAFSLTPEMDLYTRVCTASLQNKFYTSANEDLESIRKLIKEVDPDLVCKLAIYAREKMYLRSIPLVLMVELLKNLNEDKSKKRDGGNLRKTITRVIQRADEITEILSYFSTANGRDGQKKLKSLPSSLKKGIADSFHKFDRYQISKYNSDKAIKIRDALFLTCPKPKNEKESVLFKDLADKKLEAPYTWEVELSRLGQQKFASSEEKESAFKKKWENLVSDKALGYMALLRNLRNILQSGVSRETLNLICEKISSEEEVSRAKQLPFRYFSAYREIDKLSEINPFVLEQIKESLEVAVKHSVSNIKGFGPESRVVIACDVSGSMQTAISEKSSVEMYDIGLLMGQILQSRCKNVITGFFGDTWKITNFVKGNVLYNTLDLRRREGEVGYSTNGHLVINWLNTSDIEVDKVMIFTDCQLWNSRGGSSISAEWSKYRARYPNARLYLFDLSGGGTSPIDLMVDKNVAQIAGWSDKVFEVLDSVEKDDKVLDSINGIQL